jgi:hypothetical protein
MAGRRADAQRFRGYRRVERVDESFRRRDGRLGVSARAPVVGDLSAHRVETELGDSPGHELLEHTRLVQSPSLQGHQRVPDRTGAEPASQRAAVLEARRENPRAMIVHRPDELTSAPPDLSRESLTGFVCLTAEPGGLVVGDPESGDHRHHAPSVCLSRHPCSAVLVTVSLSRRPQESVVSTPGAGAPGLRKRLAHSSVPLLAMLDRVPRFVVSGVLAILLLLGLFGPRWVATVCLAVVTLVLGWLVALVGVAGGTGRVALRIGSLVILVVLLAARAAGAGVGV